MKKIFNFFRVLLPVCQQIYMAMCLLCPTGQESNGVPQSPAGGRKKVAPTMSARVHTALLRRGGGSCSARCLKRGLSTK